MLGIGFDIILRAANGISTALYRITEDGQFMTTESGQQRVVEDGNKT